VRLDEDADGIHAVVGTAGQVQHLRIAPGCRSAGSVHLPLRSTKARIEAAHWFLASIAGTPRGLAPEALWLRRRDPAHLRALLRLLDARACRATMREIAAVFFDAGLRRISAADWIDCRERKRLMRWLKEAERLVRSDYRHLLSGP
jgi:hypothetical protein